MPDTAQSLPSSEVANFASLLAGLTAPNSAAKAHSKAASNSFDRWDDDAYAEDVTTLSYEQALRKHARYRPSIPPNLSSLPSQPDLDPSDSFQAESAQLPAPDRATLHTAKSPTLSLEANRKSASITMRLSHAECVQLRERAAAAGLTVSAYLRSCVFEVESLRAQVKDTLAQLRTASVSKPQPAQSVVRTSNASTFDRRPSPGSGTCSRHGIGVRAWQAPDGIPSYSTSSTRHLRYSVSGRFSTTG